MTNPISFGSTFKAYITRNDVKQGTYSHTSLTNYLQRNNIPYKQTFENSFKANGGSRFIPAINDYAVSKYDIIAPDEFDYDIETICANRGIKYEKIDTRDLIGALSIMYRLKEPNENGQSLVFIDSKKLEKLVENQESNFEHCKSDYEKYFKDSTDFALKSGDEITPQTLYITSLFGNSSPEALKEYVNRFGKDKLNPDSIAIYQEQRGDRTNINMYYGLKDLGFSYIPVYMDETSIENAKTLGLLVQN